MINDSLITNLINKEAIKINYVLGSIVILI
jgi:hypothetical protein